MMYTLPLSSESQALPLTVSMNVSPLTLNVGLLGGYNSVPSIYFQGMDPRSMGLEVVPVSNPGLGKFGSMNNRHGRF